MHLLEFFVEISKKGHSSSGEEYVRMCEAFIITGVAT